MTITTKEEALFRQFIKNNIIYGHIDLPIEYKTIGVDFLVDEIMSFIKQELDQRLASKRRMVSKSGNYRVNQKQSAPASVQTGSAKVGNKRKRNGSQSRPLIQWGTLVPASA